MSAAAYFSHDPFYLLEQGMIARFREWVEDAERGWGTFEVLSLEVGPLLWRATIEQADSRGDRYRYQVIRTAEGVAAEIHGEHDLVVHDWIWRFPILERSWTEEVEDMTVSYQLYYLKAPVAVEAGSFEGCLRLTAMTPMGSSAHTYHPTAGLVLSEFTDETGTPGRRELYALEPRTSSSPFFQR